MNDEHGNTITPRDEAIRPGRRYLDRLDHALRALPDAERDASVDYYREMIQDRVENGMSEREAVDGLEPPEAAAATIIDDLPAVPRGIAKGRRMGDPVFWILLVVGSPVWLALLALLAMIVAGGYLLIWSAILTIWAFALTGLLAGAAALAICIWSIGRRPMAFAILILGGGLAFTALGVLLLAPATTLTRVLISLSARWTRRTLSLFTHRTTRERPRPRDPAAHGNTTRTTILTAAALLVLALALLATGYLLAGGDLTILNQRLPIGEIRI